MDNAEPTRRMRRPETEITEYGQLERVLGAARVLFLCLKDVEAPYVVPVCFGWERDTLYVHSALSGTKIDLIRADPSVGFSACTEMTLRPGSEACSFGLKAESIVGTGRARFLTDDHERRRALELIMRHYCETTEAPLFSAGSLSRTCVIAITILTLRGRQLGRPIRRLQ